MHIFVRPWAKRRRTLTLLLYRGWARRKEAKPEQRHFPPSNDARSRKGRLGRGGRKPRKRPIRPSDVEDDACRQTHYYERKGSPTSSSLAWVEENDHLGTLRRLPRATKERAGGLYGENWREDVKIRLFLDRMGFTEARQCRWLDFWGPINGLAVKTQQLRGVGSVRTDRTSHP